MSTQHRIPTRRLGWLFAAAAVLAMPAHAALSIYVEPESLAARSPVIVAGTVVETASGWDPGEGRLATYVTLAVDDVLRGPVDLERVTLREAGGRWGDLVHDVDAVPVYRAGERVVAFLEPGPDGALRTTGMFFGKFTIDVDPATGANVAVRDLDGRGRIAGHAGPLLERFALRELERSVIRSRRPAARSRQRQSWLEAPSEIDRLRWDDVRAVDGGGPATLRASADGPSEVRRLDTGDAVPVFGRFTTLSSSSPARWYETDSGTTLSMDIDPARDPLGDPDAAVAAIGDAMVAWTDVPESRVALAVGNPALDYVGTYAASPASAYPSVNVVLFGDPYDDISDPSGCSGTLAIGGYWRSGSTGAPVNGTTFYRALRSYVIFNNGFECFLGDSTRLAEVATHEIGHTLGIGHSTVTDAIMRSSAYGGSRGARLGDDDRDAVHCIYPHTLTLHDPTGGEILTGGSSHPVTWSTTAEAGPDDGEVDLEYSADGGQTWQPVAAATVNDGLHDWSVPEAQGTDYRFRVLRTNRVQPSPAGWPDACSGSASASSFTVEAAPAIAGTVPDGGAGEPLRVAPDGAGGLRLTWAASCSAGATDFAVYRGALSDLRAGTLDPVAEGCSSGGATELDVGLPAGDAYFLVAPRTGDAEGTYGLDSSGLERPQASGACAPREQASTCP